MRLSREASRGFLSSVLAKSSIPWEASRPGFTTLQPPGVELGSVLRLGFKDPAPLIISLSLESVASKLPLSCEELAKSLSLPLILEPAIQLLPDMRVSEIIDWLREQGPEWSRILSLLESILRPNIGHCNDSLCIYENLTSYILNAIAGCEYSVTSRDFSLSFLSLRLAVDLVASSEEAKSTLNSLLERRIGVKPASIIEEALGKILESPSSRLKQEVEAIRRLYVESGVSSWITLSDMTSYYSITLYYSSIIARSMALGGEMWVKRLRE